MKSSDKNKAIVAVVLVCGLALAGAGCGRQEIDEHAGHDHGPGEHAAASAGEWCAEHEIAEAECPFCNPGLVESLGWCAGHEVSEALCYQCNPNLIAAFKASGDWCGGHDRPESQCYICNPHLAPGADATANGADSSTERLPEHGLPRTQQRPSVTCAKQSLTVTFARPEIAEEAGLGFATIQELPVTRTLDCSATVAYDGNRYAQIAPQMTGVIASVAKDLGGEVEPGDVLATITSPAFGAAKAVYLQAGAAVALWQKHHKREADLLAQGVSTERDVLEAETRLAESRIAVSRAEQELLGLGLSSAQIADVARSGDTTNRYQVTAAFAGIVVDRQAAVGEVVDPSRPLFAVADISGMWALLDIYETDVRDVAVGQPVILQVEGLAGESFAGRITWISSSLDARTRTLQARAELDNSSGLLRANMFARAVVTVRNQQPTTVVPREAVQWEGCCNVVFVRQSATTYQPRKVHLGPAAGSMYEVRGGLAVGEVVVTQGSFLLKTEILKGNIGAGCCEAQPGT